MDQEFCQKCWTIGSSENLICTKMERHTNSHNGQMDGKGDGGIGRDGKIDLVNQSI